MKDTREKDDAPCSYMDLVEATRTPQGVAVGCGDVGKIAGEAERLDLYAVRNSDTLGKKHVDHIHDVAKRLRSLAGEGAV